MRILVVGAGRTGAEVLRQLFKNPDITVITTDPREKPYAVEKGIISKVDYREAVTPLNLDHVLRLTKADMVFLTRGAADLGLGSSLGMDLFSDSLKDELAAIADVPVILVAQRS